MQWDQNVCSQLPDSPDVWWSKTVIQDIVQKQVKMSRIDMVCPTDLEVSIVEDAHMDLTAYR